jgi:hypothetical protein
MLLADDPLLRRRSYAASVSSQAARMNDVAGNRFGRAVPRYSVLTFNVIKRRTE